MTRGAPSDNLMRVCKTDSEGSAAGSARSGPEPSLTSLPENLIPLVFLRSFPCYVKVPFFPASWDQRSWKQFDSAPLSADCAQTSGPTTNIIVSSISFRKGWHNRLAASAEANSGASRAREDGGPCLRPLLLRGKFPQRASGPAGRFCGGRGSSVAPGGHFSVTCGNAPLCPAHGAGNIFLEFSPNTQQVWV